MVVSRRSLVVGGLAVIALAGGAYAAYTGSTGSGITITYTDPVGVRPDSGVWSFRLEGSTARLEGPQCPPYNAAQDGGFISNGEATLIVAPVGNGAQMLVDGQTLGFTRQPGTTMMYRTGTRHFPVQRADGGMATGKVHFEFVANTRDSIIGTLHWNNTQGCVGAYPFTMAWLRPTNLAAGSGSTTVGSH